MASGENAQQMAFNRFSDDRREHGGYDEPELRGKLGHPPESSSLSTVQDPRCVQWGLASAIYSKMLQILAAHGRHRRGPGTRNGMDLTQMQTGILDIEMVQECLMEDLSEVVPLL